MSNNLKSTFVIERPYSWEDVRRLQTSLKIENTLAYLGAQKLRKLLISEKFIKSLGALNGSQAVQMVRCGIKAIYVSGWQVAADCNLAAETYPDLSLYPSNSVPFLVKRINKALQRANQIEKLENNNLRDWYIPIVADAEAGYGGILNVFELIKLLIESGASAIHLEDQDSQSKRCGHMGGQVLIPTSSFIKKLIAARLAADVLEVPTVLIARTDAENALFLTNDNDECDKKFISGNRSSEGYFCLKGDNTERAIERGLAYAPYADLLWMETKEPDLSQAKEFADAIHEKFPGKILAYNCSPSFLWKKFFNENQLLEFQDNLSEFGYKFQFVTLAGFHSNNYSMFELAKNYKSQGMLAYSNLQHKEEQIQQYGYSSLKHQSDVGTSYFDEVFNVVNSRNCESFMLKESTENKQFK